MKNRTLKMKNKCFKVWKMLFVPVSIVTPEDLLMDLQTVRLLFAVKWCDPFEGSKTLYCVLVHKTLKSLNRSGMYYILHFFFRVQQYLQEHFQVHILYIPGSLFWWILITLSLCSSGMGQGLIWTKNEVFTRFLTPCNILNAF